MSGDFIFRMSARVAKNLELSDRALALYVRLRAYADARTNRLPPWLTPDKIEKRSCVSKPTRLRLEAELVRHGLLTMEQAKVMRQIDGKRRLVYGPKVYILSAPGSQKPASTAAVSPESDEKSMKKAADKTFVREETLRKEVKSEIFDENLACSSVDKKLSGSKSCPTKIHLCFVSQSKELSKEEPKSNQVELCTVDQVPASEVDRGPESFVLISTDWPKQ